LTPKARSPAPTSGRNESFPARIRQTPARIPTAFLIYALAKGGKQAEARRELEKLLDLASTRSVLPYTVALAYHAFGETDKAFEWLDRGFRERSILMIFLQGEPKWRSAASDPHYQGLIRRMNFPIR